MSKMIQLLQENLNNFRNLVLMKKININQNLDQKLRANFKNKINQHRNCFKKISNYLRLLHKMRKKKINN